MKNIAIFGGSRSGKSTLAKMISKKYSNYHIYIGDDIQWAFQEVLPKNNINNQGGIGMEEDFPNFLSCLFYKSIKRNKDEINYIIESCDISPEKASLLFNREDTVLLFLGTANLTAEDQLKEIRQFETEKDWTYKMDDEQILDHSEYWISKCQEYERECKNLNLWYVDTSFNREKILNETLDKIDKMMIE